MKKSLYLISHGILSRKDNTLQYINENVKTALPISQIQDIHALGKISLRSGAIGLLAEKNIPIHFYNKYQFHTASLIPRTNNTNGTIIVAQTRAYLDKEKRQHIAKAIVNATRHNMIKVLEYYAEENEHVAETISEISKIQIPNSNIGKIMAKEAQIWKQYYQCFNQISPALPFEKRTFYPPHNEMNSLISLLNTLTYSTVLTQIMQTYLHPAISYLHEPLERRYSLALDLAEHFKPLIAHRIIFRLVNRKQITKSSFEKESTIRLKEPALKKVLEEFQKQLDTTVHDRKLKRKISYRPLIKQDAHKLVKYVIEDVKTFSPYKIR